MRFLSIFGIINCISPISASYQQIGERNYDASQNPANKKYLPTQYTEAKSAKPSPGNSESDNELSQSQAFSVYGTPYESSSSKSAQAQNIKFIKYEEFHPVDEAFGTPRGLFHSEVQQPLNIHSDDLLNFSVGEMVRGGDYSTDLQVARRTLTSGRILDRAAVVRQLIKIIGWYNDLVSKRENGPDALKDETDLYILTLYTVMCELSIKDNHDLGQPCQTLNPRDEDTMKFVMNQLVGLMNKAHGHAAEEVDETGNSKLHLHAENLNRFKTQRSLRSEEDHSENDEEQFPYQPSLKSFVQSSQQSGWGESQNQWLGNLESSDRHSGEPENQSRGNLQILGQQQEITERDPEIQVTQTFRKRNGVEHQSQFIPDMQQSQFPSDRESYRQPAFNMGVHQEHTQLKPKQLALTLSRQAENTPAHLRRADEQSFSGTDED